MKPLVRRLCPVGGRREPLCQTDEARVSRLLSPRYASLVERLQPVVSPQSPDHDFILTLGSVRLGRCDAGQRRYHIHKFLSMALAKALFPDNFANYRELRIGVRSGRWSAATYSDFVPDETSVGPRRRENYRRYHELLRSFGPGRATDFCMECNIAERRINPVLGELDESVSAAGLGMAHPEANYHVAGGRTVFFEVDWLDVQAALNAAWASPLREAALERLAVILSTELVWHALLVLKKASPGSFEFRMASEFTSMSIQYLKPALARFLAGSPALLDRLTSAGIHQFVGTGYTILKDALPLQSQLQPEQDPSLTAIGNLPVADIRD